MFSFKSLLSHYSKSCLKPPINPSEIVGNPNHHAQSTTILKYWLISLATHRLLSVSTQPETSINAQSKNSNQNKRRLDVLFKEAIGLCEKSEFMGNESELNGEDGELKKKLWDLEMELRQLRVESEEKQSELGEEKVEGVSMSKPKSLLALFDSKDVEKERKREELVLKEISSDMQLLIRHLYDRGYFRDVNFLQGNTFHISYFDNEYARDFLRFAVERFGKDNQEISKWLSGGDLKTLALFGCPSLKKREVFAAKRLRIYFKIPEETVCSKCMLKDSCKFVNQSVWKSDATNLRLDLLMRLLRAYSLEDIPPQLKLTDDVKGCVSRLMNDVINLTKSS